MSTIDIKIQKPAYGGYGLGFHNGKACFVPYSVPGDQISVELYKEKKDYCFGSIIKINEKSGARIEPKCPNFGICGGCDYLNVGYDYELQQKKEILSESLQRIAGQNIENIPLPIIKGERFNYRSHASIKADAERRYGFYGRESNVLTPFPESGCRLLADPLKKKLSELKAAPAEFKIACSFDGSSVASMEKRNIVKESEKEILYERGISDFFQSNRFLRSKMLETAGDYAGITSNETFLDIGCGVGFFTLYLAKGAKSGHGIDIDKESIKWARHNAAANHTGNVTFEARSASKIASLKQRFDVIIADPPRAGLSDDTRASLKAMHPRRFVYVSCNPATFARDTADIMKGGLYPRKITLIDMFPGTHHIELIALFA